jgi:hypothetical protein
MSAKFLDDLVPYAKFATDEVDKHPRTVVRWMKMPDGLPYTVLGNQKLIHIPTAREWLLRRMRNPNPRRDSNERGVR